MTAKQSSPTTFPPKYETITFILKFVIQYVKYGEEQCQETWTVIFSLSELISEFNVLIFHPWAPVFSFL